MAILERSEAVELFAAQMELTPLDVESMLSRKLLTLKDVRQMVELNCKAELLFRRMDELSGIGELR